MSPPPRVNFELRAGETLAFSSITAGASLLSALAVRCTVKRWHDDVDAEALTQVDCTVLSASAFSVVVGSDLTRHWPVAHLRYDIEADNADGTTDTVQYGRLTVQRRVTLEISSDYVAGAPLLQSVADMPGATAIDVGYHVAAAAIDVVATFPSATAVPGPRTAAPALFTAAPVFPAPDAIAGDIARAPVMQSAASILGVTAQASATADAPTLASGAALSGPTATPGGVQADAPLLAPGATLPVPAGVQDGSASAPQLAPGSTFAPPTATGAVAAAAPAFAPGSTMPAPSAAATITASPSQLTRSPVFSAPTATATITASPGRLTSTATFPAPTGSLGPAFPLKVNTGGRYYEDQNGVPFRLQSLAMWTMSTGATTADMQTAIANAASKGFNALILMNVVKDYSDAHFDWSQTNRNGDDPFTQTTAGGHVALDHPNDDYFDHIALIIETAASYGMAVQLFYLYSGYNGGGQGLWDDVNDSHNTQTVCFNFGVYLGTKLGSYANLIWMVGGDYLMPADASTPSGEGRTRVHKVLEGIRSVTTAQIAGNEWNDPDSHSTDQAGFTYGTNPATSDIQGDWFYSFGPGNDGHTYVTADESWDAGTTLPGVAEETVWVYSSYSPTPSSREDVRAQQHWALTSGALGGTTWGISDIASWDDSGALSAFSDAAMADQSHAFAMYGSLGWQKHVPSGKSGIGSRTLVVSGGGSGDSKITSSMASDGSSLLAYVPSTGTSATTFSVDLRGMSGSGTMLARWWNPTSGAYTTISGTFDNTQSAKSVTTPGNNGTGTNDWMLVITVS